MSAAMGASGQEGADQRLPVTESYGDLVESIATVRFTPVRIRDGYDMSDVDELLDRLVAALGRGEPVGRVIDEARLGHVRLREGYDIGEVDAFLAGLRRRTH